MILQFKDLRSGIVKLRIDSVDDLWYLSQIIAPGDEVKTKTQRRIKDKQDQRSKGGQRKIITLVISVERTEFKAETRVLRVSGVIVDGPPDIVSVGTHHSFNLEAGSVIYVKKDRWMRSELGVVDEAVKGSLRPKILIASIDGGEATLALARESRIEYLDLFSNIGGKYDQDGRQKRKQAFYEQLAGAISGVCGKENVSSIILSGPGFDKSSFYKFLAENKPELAEIAGVEDTGGSGKNGVREVLAKDALNRSVSEINSVRDLRLVEDLLAEIGRDSGLATYGLDHVRKAVESAAVEILAVSDEFFFNNRSMSDFLFKSVSSKGGRHHIINSSEEAGLKLASIGSVAAKLRYPIH